MEKFILKNFTLIRTIIAIAIGVAVSVLLIYLISATPSGSLKYFFVGPLLSKSRLSNVFEMAAPIMLCGVAIAVAFQAEQFNIGAEGALYISAAVATAFAVSTHMPAILHIPLTILIAACVGAAWGFVPGILKAKLGASELVATLMMNYIAYFLGLYLINYHFRDKSAGYLVSYALPETARLGQFIPGTRMHWGIILAVIIAVLVYFFLYHTTTGYEIRMTGSNRKFARFGGINIIKVVILSQVISGALAGVGGIFEVMGIHGRFNWQTSPGYGWDGVIVAIIGRNHPILIIFASLFLSYLRVGGSVVNLMADVPTEMVSVIQSVIILLITAEAFLSRWKYRITVREAEREEKIHESAS
ncbi:MAG: ABC transporter permease [Spirochaetales bacterium]|nr:ABC transporter permease [Spirochaetales bacterium]